MYGSIGKDILEEYTWLKEHWREAETLLKPSVYKIM